MAIKVILPQYANQPDFARRFETEAQLVAHLEHIHIVPLYNYERPHPSLDYRTPAMIHFGMQEDR